MHYSCLRRPLITCHSWKRKQSISYWMTQRHNKFDWKLFSWGCRHLESETLIRHHNCETNSTQSTLHVLYIPIGSDELQVFILGQRSNLQQTICHTCAPHVRGFLHFCLPYAKHLQTFLVVIYLCYIAQCRLKSVGFTTSRKINSLRELRN